MHTLHVIHMSNICRARCGVCCICDICVTWLTLRSCIPFIAHRDSLVCMTHAPLYGSATASATWLVHTCDVTHLHVWYALFLWQCDCIYDMTCGVRLAWLPCMYDRPSSLNQCYCTCDITRSYVWRDSIVCMIDPPLYGSATASATWLVHMCGVTHVNVLQTLLSIAVLLHLRHDSFICVTWLTWMYYRPSSLWQCCCICDIRVTWLTFHVIHMSHICLTWITLHIIYVPYM